MTAGNKNGLLVPESTTDEEFKYIKEHLPEGVEIEENGVRETDAEYRKQIDFTINNIVNRYPHRIKNLHKISGSTEGRIEQIKRAISL